jgi:hypothetical protein
MRYAILSFLLLLSVYAPSASGQTIYVDAVANGANDGSSWDDSYNYLQDALSSAIYGDEIRVAEGIYTPDCNSSDPNGSKDRAATFQLTNGVVVKGGYAGFGEPNPNARDIEVYDTILSGDLNLDDGPDFANNTENAYLVVTGSGTDANTILDGFTITGGNSEGSGGGMRNSNSQLTVANCIFSRNVAGGGGGMWNSDGNPTVTNCIFSGNVAS